MRRNLTEANTGRACGTFRQHRLATNRERIEQETLPLNFTALSTELFLQPNYYAIDMQIVACLFRFTQKSLHDSFVSPAAIFGS
jgi:hypothetical protein